MWRSKAGMIRILNFGAIGVCVMLLGALLLSILVEVAGMDRTVAYAVQAVFSIEFNFLLNSRITWRDRTGSWRTLLAQWTKFHVAKVVTVLLNQAVFLMLATYTSAHYLVIYFLCVLVVTAANFVLNEKLVFLRSEAVPASK